MEDGKEGGRKLTNRSQAHHLKKIKWEILEFKHVPKYFQNLEVLITEQIKIISVCCQQFKYFGIFIVLEKN
jgi:hypothetical protein